MPRLRESCGALKFKALGPGRLVGFDDGLPAICGFFRRTVVHIARKGGRLTAGCHPHTRPARDVFGNASLA
jgi:hypothetical protein